MRAIQNIVSLLFPFCLVALPIKESTNDGDDFAPLSQLSPEINELSANESDKGMLSGTESSIMKPEKNVLDANLLDTNTLGRNGVTNKTLYWPNGIIPYRIDGLYRPQHKNMIMKALDTIQFWTCIQFVPFNGQEDHLAITHYMGTGCYSDLGRQGGRQVVYLERNRCLNQVGDAMHEILHAIGIIHEHSRPDRDDYIKIFDRDIMYGWENNFEKYSPGQTSDFGVPYDYNSIMHYAEHEGSARGLKTIEPKMDDGKWPYAQLGQRYGLSVRDVIKIRNMYNCYYEINDKEHTSKVLPNPDVKNITKAELWNTYFRNFKDTRR